MMEIDTISPDWPLSDKVGAFISTRSPGHGRGPFQHFNLAEHVGDDSKVVQDNRGELSRLLPAGTRIQWLQQVHGTRVLKPALDSMGTELVKADAIYLDRVGVAGAVMVADCLPVLLAAKDGREAAVAHAGWRGLLGGVLEETLACFRAPREEIHAWMGPAIGPCHFEVGAEVREAFLAHCAQVEQARLLDKLGFMPGGSGNKNKWQANLYAIASLRLSWSGVKQIHGGGLCTYCDPERFFSYRRDGVTGRMASLIYLKA
ncbi:MAG: peptidoglycan editing factor PgeF [Pseudomonadales bacterium]|nr:peptidoglycan editing factor PgeF [Pseudomonadales bacterium]